ncbi:hypothetical protein D1AOALGA4SA_297 [Olavius algarvensis Delta 1 endosymbiont]|nr:hypothetical protein D1AOALGA4SA_297 [Olavius algarvensis Delta 1 endosymbiont]
MSNGGIASGFAFGYEPTGRSVFLNRPFGKKSSRQAESNIRCSMLDVRC